MVTLPPAGGDDVHLWLEWTDETPETGGIALLDDEEQARGRRFRFVRDRHRFVARRSFLRRVLAGYVGVAPANVRYRTSPSGKPELAAPGGVAFNTSHADGLAVVAIAIGGEVGVDIERLRPIPEAVDLARRLFSAREREQVESVPASERSEAFLRLWTRKEAYVKFVGAGLSMRLDELDILDGRVRGSRRADTSPRVQALNLPAGYVGAVALAAGTITYLQQIPVEIPS